MKIILEKKKDEELKSYYKGYNETKGGEGFVGAGKHRVVKAGQSYGIKSVIPHNNPKRIGAFNPATAKPIESPTKTMKATSNVPLTHFLTSCPISLIKHKVSSWYLCGTNLSKYPVILLKSINI